MYTGDEKFIIGNGESSFSMLGYWQWAHSCIMQSMTRGTFAEYIVKSALESGGIDCNADEKIGLEPFDLYGPEIPALGRNARLEIKSTARYRIELTGAVKTTRLSFGIAPAKLPDEVGDYKDAAPRQRNNDIYVFVVCNASDPDQNILDTSYWDFYVVPTFKIEQDETLRNQKTVSLKRIQDLSPKHSFTEVADAVIDACNTITE